MINNQGIRWGWLKAMYITTVIIAGGFGIRILFLPQKSARLLGISCSSATYGIVGSVYLAFGILSILGLRQPLKYVPILLLQFTYKCIWLIGVALPLMIQNKFPEEEILTAIIFLVIVLADLIAIPFRYLFSKHDLSIDNQPNQLIEKL